LGNRDVFVVQHSSQSISLPAHSNSSLRWKNALDTMAIPVKTERRAKTGKT